MYLYQDALNLIKEFEDFHEKAWYDQVEDCFIFGYGTHRYPDKSKIKEGHCCTKEKALEFLKEEINEIAFNLIKQNLGLDLNMLNALISFVHSVGWETFLYSSIIDYCEQEDYINAAYEFNRWIVDSNYTVNGREVERRKKEIILFMTDQKFILEYGNNILRDAFTAYTGAPEQISAIQTLEESISPLLISKFINEFNNKSQNYYVHKNEIRD